MVYYETLSKFKRYLKRYIIGIETEITIGSFFCNLVHVRMQNVVEKSAEPTIKEIIVKTSCHF